MHHEQIELRKLNLTEIRKYVTCIFGKLRKANMPVLCL